MAEARVILGDALKAMAAMQAGSVALVLADPPYGITACRWDIPIPFAPMWEQLARVARRSAAFVFTAGQPFASALVMSRPEWFRHEWVWIKDRGSNFANTVREPMKEHEHALVFSRGGWTYNRQMQARSPGGASRARYASRAPRESSCYGEMPRDKRGVRTADRVPSSWQRFNRCTGLHPCQKPEAWMRYLVRTYSDPGDLVLDFCAGSGTTGVAALAEGRDFVGVELSPEYHALASRRLAAAAQPAGVA
jgi:site-specific DNA-methyltransferase (adenine-specific)